MSGAPVALAAAGYDVAALDVSRTAIAAMRADFAAKSHPGRLTYRVADVEASALPLRYYRLIVGEKYWSPAVFDRALAATAAGGLLVWSALDAAPPGRSERWVPVRGEPAGRVPDAFDVLFDQISTSGDHRLRTLIARRRQA
jgi:hypothetical protein